MKKVLFVLLTISVGIGLAADTTLLSQTFDMAWSPTNPPQGWTITYAGVDAWHRQVGYPWPDDSIGGYAMLGYTAAVVTVDTLKSPIMDCSFERNIVLRCSTFFWPLEVASYQARLLYSRDSGATWIVVRDYGFDAFGPGLETFVVDTKGLAKGVQFAWAWSGSLFDINAWCLDNVSVTGTKVFDNDAAVLALNRPYRLEKQNSIVVPSVVVANLGRLNQASVPVWIEITNADTAHKKDTVIYGPLVRYVPLLAGEQDTILFDTIPFNAPGFDLSCHETCYTALANDSAPDNDTAVLDFQVSNSDLVYYDDGTPTGRNHWPIGLNSGWGMKVTPLFYPARIMAGQFNLHLSGGSSYRLRITETDSQNQSPGALLYESQSLPAVDGWNTDSIGSLGLVINSGSFFLFYEQVGDWPSCPELNHDAARTPGAEYWALNDGIYSRDNSTANGDWMIRCALDYNPPPPPAVDARVLYVASPDDEISMRPVGGTFAPQARIDNPGSTVLVNVPVRCSIDATPLYTSDKTIDTLKPGQAVTVTFAPWQPMQGESVRVWVMVRYPGDLLSIDDTASKPVAVYRGRYTGVTEYIDRYNWIDSDTLGGPTYSWYDKTTRYTPQIQGDGEQVKSIGIGMVFTYRGVPYSLIHISNNGWLSFTLPDSSHPQNETIPRPSQPNNALYPFWDHLRAGARGSDSSMVWTLLVNQYVPGKRKFVITWDKMRFYDNPSPGPSDLVSFQVILDEETGNIIYQYKNTQGGLSSHNYGHSATVGIENAAGNLGLQYLMGDSGVRGLWPANKLTSGRAITFYSVRRDVGPLSFVEPSKAILIPGVVHPQVRIKNFGNLMVPFSAFFTINALNGGQVYRDSTFIEFMPMNYDSLFTFSDWNSSVGPWVLKCSTAMAGDMNRANDVLADTITVQPWVQRASIPLGYFNKRVRYGSLAYLQPYIYALKGANTSEFWRYNILTDSWDSLPSMPLGLGRARKKVKVGCALSAVNGLVYAFKGGGTPEFYAFNPALDAWMVRDSLPWGASFKGAGAGSSLTAASTVIYGLKGGSTNEFWRYDLSQNKWAVRTPITLLSRPIRMTSGASVQFCNDSLVYCANTNNSFGFLKYNTRDSTWRPMANVGLGYSNRKIRAGSGTAVIGDTLFLMKGGNTTELWAYDLRQDKIWTQRADIPLGPQNKRVKSGGTACAAGNFMFVLKGLGTNEFWMYGPTYDTTRARLLARRGGPQEDAIQNLSIVFACRAEPDPAVGAMKVRLAIPEPVNARVRIYDVTGKAVATLSNGSLPVGYHSIVWNRTDGLGRRVANGIYILTFESAAYHATQKLILE